MIHTLYRNRITLIAALITYLAGLIIGIFFPTSFETYQNIPFVPAIEYATHNLLVCSQLCFGFLTCGIHTFLLLFGNGFVLGMTLMVNIKTQSFLYILCGLLPHGLFEVPGFIIAGAIGFKSIEWIICKVADKTYPIFTGYWRLFILVIILISIGAIIESYITPWLINLVQI